jgi:hypothetical protein
MILVNGCAGVDHGLFLRCNLRPAEQKKKQ